MFFDDDNLKGDAISLVVSVTNACTSCQGFGEFSELKASHRDLTEIFSHRA